MTEITNNLSELKPVFVKPLNIGRSLTQSLMEPGSCHQR